jgi:hypothetical protein
MFQGQLACSARRAAKDDLWWGLSIAAKASEATFLKATNPQRLTGTWQGGAMKQRRYSMAWKRENCIASYVWSSVMADQTLS